MDIWKYYGITHTNHLICNPTDESKLNELVELLRLPASARVVDIACGKGELLCRLAARYRALGIGVDISPYEIATARARVKARALDDLIEIVEGNGAEFQLAEESRDATFCVGASWIWSGHRGTLEALSRWTKPGGLVCVGEPFKIRDPDPDYAAADPKLAAELVPHHRNVEIAIELGLVPLYAIVSSEDDWDRYQWLQHHAAEMYAVDHPEDPDVSELLERNRRDRDLYLRWGRSTVGWAIYLFRKPG